MSPLAHNPISLSECLDIVDTAAATVSRRLPVHVSTDDLVSVGKIALISALAQSNGSLDEVRAYCFVRVRGAMLDELRRLDPLSRNQRDRVNRILRAQSELSGRLARAATTVEIAVATQIPVSEVRQILLTLSQESEFVDFDLSALPDRESATPAEAVEADDLRINLRGALQRLAGNQAAVLYRYYFEDATLDVIAAEMGISKERVRQIREAGEKKLRADFTVLAIWQSLLSLERE